MSPAQRSRQLLAVDGITDLLQIHRRQPERYPCLLESVATGNEQARYDILFAFPGDSLSVDAATDFTRQFDEWWQRESAASNRPAVADAATASPDLPFKGGWFVYLSYELAGQIEPVLRLPAADDGFPVAVATRFPAAIICDHQEHNSWLFSETGDTDVLETLLADWQQVQRQPASTAANRDPADGILTIREQDSERFLDGVERIRHYIVEGDVFQVNLSREWNIALDSQHGGTLPAADLYAALRESNPAPFAALASFGGQAIVSSSPERLVRVRDGSISTRPIAGTHPRGATPEQDRDIARSLLAHPKERAEHLMLIDLERNDLGRVAVTGTVQVDELMVLETYTHVHHIVSNITARLREDATPGEVIRAVFPGGTITGCPKIRCMAIIAELEQQARGPYTGSLGYINVDGSMDLNILIRTFHHRGNRIHFRAGAGIVADSDARTELDETRAKAKGLLHALRRN